MIESSSIIQYQANNDNHQQYFKRLADFFEVFQVNCHDEWILKWIPLMTEVLIKKSIDTPRIPRVYHILRTLMQVCSKYKFFDNVKKKPDDPVESQEV